MAATPRVLFCSFHGLLDPASGAAVSTRSLLELLARRGWACGALCGPHRDAAHQPLPDDLRRQGLSFDARVGRDGDVTFAVHHLTTAGVPVTVFDPEGPPAAEPTAAQAAVFLRLFAGVCDRFQPDILLTFGGHRLARAWLEGRTTIRAVRFVVDPPPDWVSS